MLGWIGDEAMKDNERHRTTVDPEGAEHALQAS